MEDFTENLKTTQEERVDMTETVAETTVEASTTVEGTASDRNDGFSYEIKNSKSSVAELKSLFNSIVKAIESDEEISVAFKLIIQENINISKPTSTVSDMKTLITTMLKLIEKDETANNISFQLYIESK